MQGHQQLQSAIVKANSYQPANISSTGGTQSKLLIATKKKLQQAQDKENSSSQENAGKSKKTINKSLDKSHNQSNGRIKQQSDIFDQSQYLAIKKQAFAYQPQVIDSQIESSMGNNKYSHIQNSSSFQGSHTQHIQGIANNNFSNTQVINKETIDSNEIRGRRVDSPQLLVVREIKERDEEDNINMQDDQLVTRQFGTGSDDLANLLWNSREFRGPPQQHFTNESPRRAQQKNKQHNKSVDNKYGKQQRNNSQVKMRGLQREQNAHRYHHNLQNQGTKSQREIRSSMGFNELLNHLDKDVSLNQNNNLVDFKNRTTYDLLKLELSGIRRQSSQCKNKSNKTMTRSKSRDTKKTNKTDKVGVDDHSVRNQYEIMSQCLADKNKSQTNLLGKSGSVTIFQQLAVNRSKSKIPQSMVPQVKQSREQHQIQQQLSSPQRKENKPLISIDKLIKKNIKKMKEKENGVKLLKQKSEDMIKKKKVDLEKKNTQVRQINQERTLRRKTQFQMQNTKDQDILYYQVKDDNGPPKRFKSDQISFVNQQNRQHQKQSQTQKLDFDEIKEETGIINAGTGGARNKELKNNMKNNHRKSYGLDFFEIKKEIEQELRTIDQRFKPNSSSLIVKPKQNLKIIKKNTNNIPITEQSVQKIKIKLNRQKHEMTENQDSSERETVPVAATKTIVVKKDKIRRFMKAKKKELITIAMHQKKEEISKFIKMQQNMHKLNDFCKKKLDKGTALGKDGQRKHIVKKRPLNAQGASERDQATDKITNINDNSNIMFGGAANLHDSSKISTEFYEEYFRLLNSISKEQRDTSQMGMGGRSTDAMDQYHNNNINNNQNRLNQSLNYQNIQLSQNKNKRKLQRSPINRSSSPSKVTGHSGAAEFNNNQNSPYRQNQSRLILTKIAKKSKSKSNLKTVQNHPLHQQLQQKQDQQNKSVVLSKPPLDLKRQTKEKQHISQNIRDKIEPKNSRAESAPLIHEQGSLKKKLNSSSFKQSERETFNKEQGKNTNDNYNKNKSQNKIKQESFASGIFRDLSNSERLQILMYQIVIIQRAIRTYLNKSGFYQKNEQHNFQDYQSSSYNADTVVLMPQVSTLIDKQDCTADEGAESDENNSALDSDENNSQMLVINQKGSEGQDKKVIYMSNINSCSAPQSPKDESQKNTINQEIIKCIFNYDPQAPLNISKSERQSASLSQQFMIDQEYDDEEMHQEISQKPSIRTIEIEVGGDLDLKASVEDFKDNKPSIDYNMRMFTGSQSMLNELKHTTPKTKNQLSQDQFLLSCQGSQVSKKNNINNTYNVAPGQITVESKSQSHIDHHTSQSSQSLFERNSFQQFTIQKMGQIEQNNEFANLIGMREKALEYRQKKETKFIRKLYKNKQMSPRTYNNKKEQLEKWVQVEQDEIKKTKIAFNEEWKKTVQMIEDTQRNVEQMREKMKINIDDASKHHQGLFASQSSRNSNSSYLPSAKRRSLLEDEPKLSQRSLAQSTLNQEDRNKPHNLIEYLEHRWQSQKQDDDESKLKTGSQVRQGIYIEDQNDKDLPSSSRGGVSDNEQFFQQQLEQLNNDGVTAADGINEMAEKTLQRSRSEQDLSELIQKSKVSYQESEEAVDDHNLLDTQQQVESMSQTFKDLTVRKAEIQIEENQFDSQDQLPEKYKDLQSNDSILNESDLNMYFQEQQFSLADFKSLDKKKILEQQQQQTSQNQDADLDDNDGVQLEDEYDGTESKEELNTQRLLEQIREDEINELAVSPSQVVIGDVSREDALISKNNALMEELESKIEQRLEYDQMNRALSPQLDQQNYAFSQQQYLFQGAKPGQNIKIADILRQSQTLSNSSELASSYNADQLYSATTQQPMIFQNHQLHQGVNVPSPAINAPSQKDNNSILADQITQELMQQILQQVFVLPQRLVLDDQSHIVNNQVAQDQNSDVFIIDSLTNEKEQKRELIDYRQRQLIEQDLQKAEIYINEVIGVLLQSEIAALENHGIPEIQDFHKQFLNTLTAPIKRNEIEILNQLQTAEIGSYEHFETILQPNSYPILPVELYLEIERQREEQQLNHQQVQAASENPIGDQTAMGSSILQESVHIHNKAIFDALNESLIKFRPYGLQGEPMPWSNRNRRLQTKVDASSVDTERLFMMVKQDVLRWIQTYAGCQASPLFVFMRQNNILQNNQIVQLAQGEREAFDDELFQETREKRLAATLANEVIEGEHLWLNYEFEDNQVKIDLSDMILEHLVEEVVLILNEGGGGGHQQKKQQDGKMQGAVQEEEEDVEEAKQQQEGGFYSN